MPVTATTITAATQPVTVAEAKTHMRISHNDEDAYIDNIINTATGFCQQYTRRQFLTAAKTVYRRTFADPMTLLSPPLQSITSIKYYDTAGVQQTVDPSVYDADTVTGQLGAVRLAYGQSWPSIRDQFDAVEIIYAAGYGDGAADVPAQIRTAILMLTAHLYENREATVEKTLSEIPLGIKNLLGPYRVWGGDV